ncbi:hypothetical protein EPJ70_01645 [Brachyspira aalborgi]|uniref:Dynamin N-terminal domain-containing protein n=1 Tax=Brachyspira aalborgi TaxID=29522 RepID=A0A5C8F820_9SPIR|nr:dynamin family protein [Brachyspira aalborgi]TXJ46427.1 hypothetical protein EPJ70_01645 [Brachyspira aalborgi]
MTEEQYKECKEIYNSYNFDFRFLLIKKDEFIEITISLAKVFNSGIITEEEAEKIISINEVVSDSANPIKNNIATFWKIVDYFDKEFQEKIEQIKKEFKEANKIEEIINLAEEKYKKEFEEINTLHFDIYGEHPNPIPKMFGIMPTGLSFFEFQFQTDESYMEWMIFLSKSNYIAGENIIDLTLALSEIFNRNMTKEESEKLLFIKNYIEKENIETYSLPTHNYFASEKFRNIAHFNINNNEYNSIFKQVGWSIADYFNGKENYNNKNNEEENKNFNKENKINNVVENTAKEKIMIAKDYNQYKKEVLDLYNDYVKTFESFGKKVDESVSKTADKIKKEVFNLMVLGEAKSGKSTFINAYLGEEILPMDELQCTSSIIEIKRGDKFELKAQKASGEEIIKTEFNEITEFLQTHAAIPDEYRNIPITTINNWLLEYKDKKILENDIKDFLNEKEVKEANIFKIDEKEYKDLICKYINENESKWKEIIIKIEITYTLPEAMQGITIIDSPGVGAGGNVGKITEDYIEKADAIIFIKSLVGQALENNSFQELIRNKITNKKKELMFLVFTGKCRDLNDLGFEKLKHKAIEMYKNDIDKEKILFVDSKVELFIKKCSKLKTKEKINDHFKDLEKDKKNFDLAKLWWLESEKQFDRFMEKMKEKSNFNSVNVALDKFARQAHYLQLKAFLESLKKSYNEYKEIFTNSLKITEENKDDPNELENKIKRKLKEIDDTYKKMNDGIRDIQKEYIGEDENSGKIKNEVELEKNKYKKELSNFTEFDKMKTETINIIDKFKDFRKEKANEIIKECDKKLIEYSNSSSEINAEEFTPNFTEADFDSIDKSAKEESNETIFKKECFKEKRINTFNKDRYVETVKNYISNNLDDITEKLKTNLENYFDNCIQKYKDKLKEHNEKLTSEYNKLLKNKEDNDKILAEIENYKKNILAIDKNIKNIDTLKGEINNYVK